MDTAQLSSTRTLVVNLELVVEDDGTGFADEDGQRVFDRLLPLDEATARDGGGSGLGLAMVEEIVAARGGTVTVSTSPMGGARFVVRLPVPMTA